MYVIQKPWQFELHSGFSHMQIKVNVLISVQSFKVLFVGSKQLLVYASWGEHVDFKFMVKVLAWNRFCWGMEQVTCWMMLMLGNLKVMWGISVFPRIPRPNNLQSVPLIPTPGVIQELSEIALAPTITSQQNGGFLKTTISFANVILRLGVQHFGSGNRNESRRFRQDLLEKFFGHETERSHLQTNETDWNIYPASQW